MNVPINHTKKIVYCEGEHCHRLPREAAESPSLENFKSLLDIGPDTLLWVVEQVAGPNRLQRSLQTSVILWIYIKAVKATVGKKAEFVNVICFRRYQVNHFVPHSTKLQALDSTLFFLLWMCSSLSWPYALEFISSRFSVKSEQYSSTRWTVTSGADLSWPEEIILTSQIMQPHWKFFCWGGPWGNLTPAITFPITQGRKLMHSSLFHFQSPKL